MFQETPTRVYRIVQGVREPETFSRADFVILRRLSRNRYVVRPFNKEDAQDARKPL